MLNKKGLLFVLSAPSGSGKTSIANLITKNNKDVIRSISYTDRKKRKDEIDGKDYFFISKKKFQEMKNKNFFLEYSKVFDHYYGTSWEFIEKFQKKNHLLLVIDTKGALALKKKKNCILIFLMPPSMKELKNRLEKRASESKEEIKRRMIIAKKEIKKASFYDYIVINKDLNEAYDILRSIIIAEKHKLKFLKGKK